MSQGKRPTPEFRREAVRLALTSGRTRREIAEDLDIGLSTLSRWLRQERDAEEPGEDQVDLRAELRRPLNETLFSTLAEARTKITAWKEDYNRIRPHSSLGNLTPEKLAMKTRLEMKAA